MKSEADEFLTL